MTDNIDNVKDVDVETEKAMMDKLGSDVEDDLDGDFWHTVLRWHLGRRVMENAAEEAIKATARGEIGLADALIGEAERQKEIDEKIENDPDSVVPEIQLYLDLAAMTGDAPA